jgi:transposase
LISDEAAARILEEHEWLKSQVALRNVNSRAKTFSFEIPNKHTQLTVIEKL